MVVADCSRGNAGVHSSTDITRYPWTAAQPGRIPAGDAQALDGGADVAGDVEHAPLPLGIQGGGLGDGIGRGPVGGGVPTPDGDGLVDVDHLGQPAVVVHASVGAGRYEDFVTGGSSVHCLLDGGMAGSNRATDRTRSHVMRAVSVGGRCTAAQQPQQGQGQAQSQDQ